MARLPRLKVESEVGWYHLCARVAGWLDWFPFEDSLAREKLLQTIRKYLSVYFCETAGFCLMGNHYHLIVCLDKFRPVSQQELHRRARRLYSNPERVLRSPRQWERFHRRLFDVSELMRNIQQCYAKWYNGRYQRRGCFWGERFKSSILGDEQALLNALLYVELNPVRAGLVERPEAWRWSSASLRVLKQDYWLIPLAEVLGDDEDGEQVYSNYRGMLYYRGAIQTKSATEVIAEDLLHREESRGFCSPGAYSQRLRFFTEALVLGSQLQVEDWIRKLRRRGHYLRRKHSIRHKVDQATIHTLREQRRIPLRT